MDIKDMYILTLVRNNNNGVDTYVFDTVRKCDTYPRLHISKLKSVGYANLGENLSDGSYDLLIYMLHEGKDLYYTMLREYVTEQYRDDRINEII